MNDDTRHRLKVARERLADLEEQLAQVNYAVAGDAEASAERLRLLDGIEAQKTLIREMEASI
jgi:hypothetical protein